MVSGSTTVPPTHGPGASGTGTHGAGAGGSGATPPVAVARGDAVERLRPFWERLQHHPNAEYGFTDVFCRARAGRCEPLVLAIPDLSAPRALCIGRLARTRLPIRLGYRTLLRPRVTALELVQGGLLGPCDDVAAAALADAVLELLGSGAASVLRVEHLPLDHPFAGALRARGATPAKPLPDLHWTASVGGGWETFLRGRSRNTRRNLRRFEQGFLSSWGDRYSIRRYDRQEHLDAVVRDLEQVAKATYHRGLGAGFVDTAETRALVLHGLREGSYRAWVLHVDERPAAFWDGRSCRGVFHTGTTGYLPELAASRPGWFLLSRLLRELSDDPQITAVDFGTGDAQYKQMLGDRSWPELPLMRFAPTLRGRWLQALTGTALGVERLCRRVLDRTGLTGRLKRRWRRRLARPGAAGEAGGA